MLISDCVRLKDLGFRARWGQDEPGAGITSWIAGFNVAISGFGAIANPFGLAIAEQRLAICGCLSPEEEHPYLGGLDSCLGLPKKLNTQYVNASQDRDA